MAPEQTTGGGFLPYEEPGIAALLTLASFALALNAVNAALDRLLYCGLVGQVLVGTAWGAPGARWLGEAAQRAVGGWGYLGLVLVVFEGGIATSTSRMRANLPLSLGVAATGIAAPIGLSFLLLPALAGGGSPPVSALQRFAAGAALCSTSLGTTFTVLGTSGLARTRLGAVLSTAAMLDDVAGLVMVQVVASLGGPGGIRPQTVLRPVLVSLAFAAAAPLACRFARAGKWGIQVLGTRQARFAALSLLLLGLVAAAGYAGASVLLAAYVAGVLVSWWDGQRDGGLRDGDAAGTSATAGGVDGSPAGGEAGATAVMASQRDAQNADAVGEDASPPADDGSRGGADAPVLQQQQQQQQQQQTGGDGAGSGQLRYSGLDVYEEYYSQAVNRVLKPFFFASIGFSIPISKMFTGEVVWRGIIYSILMMFGKLVCGAWLLRMPVSVSGPGGTFKAFVTSCYTRVLSRVRPQSSKAKQTRPVPSSQATEMTSRQVSGESPAEEPSSSENQALGPSSVEPAKPLSLYPSAIMAFAMVARGEIGFLISSVAESKGIFRRPDESSSEASELFLIVTWAIFLCTIIGPVSVGLLVRRVKKLKKASAASRGSKNVLGAWGVQ
ncbi:Sodium/hydrogen exchanger family-domain-containing protein [Xylariomycetidae sp. FL0641]|nr:Sodium/hydrogen exchanger family-domain-containing protein [Xylariomycetidae sp. FL0641]